VPTESDWTLMRSNHFVRVISLVARNAVIFARIWFLEICLPLACRGSHSCASEFSKGDDANLRFGIVLLPSCRFGKRSFSTTATVGAGCKSDCEKKIRRSS
jgi:hypothetical protein